MAAAWHFSVRAPTSGEKRVFGYLGVLYLLVAAAAVPWAATPGLVDPRIATIAGSAILVASACTALLLAGWYLSTGRPALLTLAAGYVYACVMAGLHVATFPAAVFRDPLFGDEQTSAWLFVAWRTGIVLAFLAAVTLEAARAAPTPPAQRSVRLAGACCAAMVVCALIAYGVTGVGTDALIGDRWTAQSVTLTWIAAALAVIALGVIVVKRGFDDSLYLWLSLVIVAGGVDLVLSALSGARFTLGWHLAGASFVVSSYLLLAFTIGALAPRAQRRLPAAVAAYGGAIAAVLASLLLRWLLVPWLGIEMPYITMFGATAVAVWLGGWAPAVVATVIGYTVIHALLDQPYRFSIGTTADLLQLALFAVSSSLIIGLGEGMRRARDLYRSSEIELRERAAQLQRADVHKSQFLAVLSHELRNPLAPLRNGLAVLKLRPNASAAKNTVEMMDRQITQLTRLIDDLLDVSRIDRGKLELRKQKVALEAVARAAIETALPGIEAKQHELVVRYPGQPLYVDGDPVRLGQVIANLLNNAAKFTPDGGRIELAMRAEDGSAVLSVADTGIGLPPESLGEVFDMFVQLDSGRTTAPGGLGLGLTLVRSLVVQHGGRVEARSAGKDKGTEFLVTLPLAPPAPASAAAPSPTQSESRRRILVVDDNVDAAETLAELLRLQGHGVEAVYDGDAALATAEKLRPDVAFVDLNMPGIDGLEVARRLRATAWGRTAKLVALTGMGQKADLEQTRAAGFDEHLTKPADPARLARIAASTGGNVVLIAKSSGSGPCRVGQPP